MADLSKMTRKQLERLIKDAERALKTISTKEKREAKKAAEKAAAKFGFTLSELTSEAIEAPARTRAKSSKPKAAKKSSSPAKYANPSDKSQTWTGKGRQPAWYKAAIEAGIDPKKMEI